MEEKQQGLTLEEKQEIDRAIEKYYGVKLGPWTEEDEQEAKELARLWNEQRQKGRSSGKLGSKDTTRTE